MLTQGRLKELLEYCPESGVFRWRVKTSPKSRNVPGEVTGSFRKTTGYIGIKIDGVQHLAHRLAWLYAWGEWPEQYIDHVNRDRTDNRLSNLREATNAQNQQNAGTAANNTTGVKGVHFARKRGRYVARLSVAGRRVLVGHFDTLPEASAAMEASRVQHHKEFANRG